MIILLCQMKSIVSISKRAVHLLKTLKSIWWYHVFFFVKPKCKTFMITYWYWPSKHDPIIIFKRAWFIYCSIIYYSHDSSWIHIIHRLLKSYYTIPWLNLHNLVKINFWNLLQHSKSYGWFIDFVHCYLK